MAAREGVQMTIARSTTGATRRPVVIGGTALLMSSKGEEYSLEDGGLRSGIFSHFLVKGLKGEADTSGDKIVSVRELFNFVYKQVRLYTGNVQTPTLTGQFDDNMPVAAVRD